MVGYYIKNVCGKSIAEGNAMEALALRKASKILYASEWAACSAMQDYGIDPRKIAVVPFGANIEKSPPRRRMRDSSHRPLNLLFVGKDWERKGGSIAYQVVKMLQSRGDEAILHIVGCKPEDLEKDPSVRIHGFYDKRDRLQSRRLADLYSKADFLILPSREECYGVVICEAFAHSLPVLAHETGGIPTIVKDGTNGFLSATNDPKDFVEFITKHSGNRRYHRLQQAARSAYEERFNWDAAGRRIRDIIESLQ